jgi:hypothetical protein
MRSLLSGPLADVQALPDLSVGGTFLVPPSKNRLITRAEPGHCRRHDARGLRSTRRIHWRRIHWRRRPGGLGRPLARSVVQPPVPPPAQPRKDFTARAAPDLGAHLWPQKLEKRVLEDIVHLGIAVSPYARVLPESAKQHRPDRRRDITQPGFRIEPDPIEKLLVAHMDPYRLTSG